MHAAVLSEYVVGSGLWWWTRKLKYLLSWDTAECRRFRVLNIKNVYGITNTSYLINYTVSWQCCITKGKDKGKGIAQMYEVKKNCAQFCTSVVHLRAARKQRKCLKRRHLMPRKHQGNAMLLLCSFGIYGVTCQTQNRCFFWLQCICFIRTVDREKVGWNVFFGSRCESVRKGRKVVKTVELGKSLWNLMFI